MRSFLAFWMGGASIVAGAPAVTTVGNIIMPVSAGRLMGIAPQ